MISAPASITFANAHAALAQLESALAVGAVGGTVAAVVADEITLDCTTLTQFDSTAVAALLALQRRCAATNTKLRCVNLPANLRKLAALYGVDGLIAS